MYVDFARLANNCHSSQIWVV